MERLIQQLTTSAEQNPTEDDATGNAALRQTVVDIALTAEELAEQLALDTLAPAQFKDKILREVERYHQVIEAHQARERLTALNADTKSDQTSPLDALEAQYRIRDSLMNNNRTTS